MSWICPKCERELKHLNATHYCIKVSVDSLFTGKPAELVLVFDKLLAEVADWDDVLISTSKNCIVFVHKRTFFVIRPMRKQLDLKFYSAKKPTSSIIIKSEISAGKYENSTRIWQLSDLTMELFGMIKESYVLL